MPDEERSEHLTSSAATREALSKVFKPSDCALKINKISSARGNAIKIEALAPDLAKVRAHRGLIGAGLKVVENTKFNPRLIVHGVPVIMSHDEIREELIAQNLQGQDTTELRVIYKFPMKNNNSKYTSCVIEVAPAIRGFLMRQGCIYLRYSVCRFADHVWVMQCFRCQAADHLAANCKSPPRCRHCAGEHETRDCSGRDRRPKCINCMRGNESDSTKLAHSAADALKCPFLCKKIKDKISNINYG